jgi:uncharacterized protein YjbI with pentapeptide repeats
VVPYAGGRWAILGHPGGTRTIGADDPTIAVPPGSSNRWPVIRRWLLGVAAVLAVAAAVAALLTERAILTTAAWTFASLPIVYVGAAAIRGRMASPTGIAIVAALVLVVTASTVIALTGCRQRLEPQSDLAGCDLSGEDLSGLDLTGSDLAGANLSGATLRRTILDDADLTGANAQEANVGGASFRNTVLARADLRDLDLTGAAFQPATLDGAVLDGANLRGVDLVGVSLRDASARGADLTGADLSDADLSGVALDGATLDRVSLIGTRGLSDDALAQALGVSLEDLGGTLTDREIRLEFRDEILASLGDACGGRGVRGTTAYPQGAFHPMVILDERGGHGADTDRAVDLGWEPMAVRFAQLVACVSAEEQSELETCPYMREGQFATITRVQNRRSFQVVEAATGRTVLQRSLTGSVPEPCPLVHVFTEPNFHVTLSGSSIGFGKLRPELERLVGQG